MSGTNILDKKTCICCDRDLSGNKSREHVIPQWLLQELGLEPETFYQHVVRKSDEEVIEKRQHAASSFVFRRVCKSCNNGWMSDLESRASPLLVSLIRGGRTAFGLSAEERALLASWARKTAYVMSYASLRNQPALPTHFRDLVHSSTPPSGVGVFAGHHTSTGAASVFQSQDWPHLHLEPQRGIAIEKEEGYKLGLQLKGLLLLVCYSPDVYGRFLLASGVHIPVWPIDKIYPSYDSAKELPGSKDSPAMLARFCATLGVLHSPPPSSRLWLPR